jgi:hypothetical protein
VSAAARRTTTSSGITFRGNLRSTRHGWLRLTPAYSVSLVRELVERRSRQDLPVLDPFCGTGTTLLACAELGIACTTVDLNPFLAWLAQVKSRRYTAADLGRARALVETMARAAQGGRGRRWVPELHRIEKWWDEPSLDALSRAFEPLREARGKAHDLAALAFCRTLIDAGNVSFRHQSMSFEKRDQAEDVAGQLRRALSLLEPGLVSPLGSAEALVVLADSRALDQVLPLESCGSVVTSPPYVNRMSYIRELRPYMYWLGHLRDGRQAGELDWQAIGGTWGVATSKLSSWRPDSELPLRRLRTLTRAIERRSPVLARYVERYFHDMDQHLASLGRVLAAGAEAHYVIGNSKFFDVMVPAEKLLAQLFERHGFVDVRQRVLRRRTSKKELFEFLVSARRPA